MSSPDGPRPPALLLIGCSRRKAAGVRRARAWDLYDGRLFQVLKKALRDRPGWEGEVEVLIVSAKYGVIPSDRTIAAYDDRLTLARARGGLFVEGLRAEVDGRPFRAVHANLGRAYLAALPDLDALFAPTPVDRASGGIGVRNAQTRRWVLDALSDGTGG